MNEKKDIILEKVAQLFFKYGIRSVTMDDIAHDAGISKKTLYQHFKDKETLISEFVDTFFICNPNFNLTKGEGLNAIDKVMKIRKHMEDLFKLFQSNLEHDLRRFYPAIYQTMEDFKRVKIYEDDYSLIEQGKKEGLFRQEVDPHFIARLTVGRFLLLFNPDYGLFTEQETHSIELFDKAVDYHFHGICTDKGIQYFKQQLNKIQNEN
ncbi:TetR/AcrR family transcriptional regulator [Mangrovibacterium sp.]|uniref:TetR/AcrR family transcriptional regulator n=1 Tax=Mangrovibacterium sp. TaxID=1961364 RepID=UPI0035685ED9